MEKDNVDKILRKKAEEYSLKAVSELFYELSKDQQEKWKEDCKEHFIDGVKFGIIWG